MRSVGYRAASASCIRSARPAPRSAHSKRRRLSLPRRREQAMPLEIERKFPVAHDGWKKCIVRHSKIRDGLIASNNGNKTRVRITDDKANNDLKSRRMGKISTD